MSDIYVPGVKSRFNTDKLIEDLMQVERVPRDRVEKHVDTLQTQKTYWQEMGRRMSSLRESARQLFSFQNPFNERIVVSQDDSVITATATREAAEQKHNFTVKQVASADRFISAPLPENYKINGGTYDFSIGEDRISFNFRGGTLREFSEALNRRGKDKIQSSLIAVETGTRSLLIESLVTGEKNRLGFSGDSEALALNIGMGERTNDSTVDFVLRDATVQSRRAAEASLIKVAENTLSVAAGGRAIITPPTTIPSSPNLIISFETLTTLRREGAVVIPQPPPGPEIPTSGSASYGGITVENDLSEVNMPPWIPPEAPARMDDLGVLTFTYTDGTSTILPPITDSTDFKPYQFQLQDIAGDKTIVSLELVNNNTHRDVSIKNIRIYDPNALGGFTPRSPVSAAADALITMDGIEIRRPTNNIDDLIPGVTITPRAVSDRPLTLGVQPDREGIKDSIISMVGNYNRLLADINVLTRNDERIIQELSYLTPEEQEEYRKKLGVFSGDSTLSQFKNTLQRAASSPYPTSDSPILLSQIGIGTDVRRSGASGYDASRLRGYLEIDEKALDAALETRIPQIRQLFGFDSDGDLLVDSGLAHTIDTLARPYVETGGIISLKTGTIDSRVDQDQRRMETLDRQLASKESALKMQYGQMEGAYNRMERMSTSLDQFSQRANNNNN
ncbi:flagellar hook-associated protein 2 (HAP2) (Filament cap protein)(Flagellar cap protein) [Treponema primitia ZAS-2]|uniref:Flagellar hook-associated protein 2 n=1 Tax=Treponema primitia (strain ATCC BAA-887 / DSM 12427 / ZAS-2) TaxID=545694 RepID=F5YKK5_TREPZ|nr:flagellar filament capping protein FliD [Treponema primitia]AEF86134.1 flagellar hook-associated protein 2 (HAP2) (Filament cap protein)(Flagellar cap protein) [Treponema primitia ZAS-2]